MTSPFGSWPSPITAERVAQRRATPIELRTAGDTLWWLETRPRERGRGVVCRARPGEPPSDVTSAEHDVRTRVHEYGGGAYAVHDQTVIFVNLPDQRLYRQDGDGEAYPLTPPPPVPAGHRYADLVITPDGARVVCVRERHEPGAVTNDLVALPLTGGEPDVLATGRDFYSSPAVSPDGTRLAWLEWDHPGMPWTGTELRLAELPASGAAGPAGPARTVAGGPHESICQPRWSPDGRLHFITDRSGWWNLWVLADEGPAPVAPMASEVGWPQWAFGLSTYAFLTAGRVALVHGVGPARRLSVVAPDGALTEVDTPFSVFFPPQLHALGDRLACLAGGPDRASAVVCIDPSDGAVTVVRGPAGEGVSPGYLSVPGEIHCPTPDGEVVHALFYPPRNPDHQGRPDERPPLVVVSHGGPTSGIVAGLDLTTQFFTSRGFAVAAVDYRGSTGYGRAYRHRLAGEWGVLDVADCVTVARWLAEAGAVDGDRMVIRGTSAGGYASLCAVAFHHVFAAATGQAAISDVQAFITDTHKFEERYLDWLIGPLPAAMDAYRQRSPIRHLDRIRVPVLLVHGSADPIVPVSEAEKMYAALRERGLPCRLLVLDGEQHGLRRSDSIQRALEVELEFYRDVLGIPAQPEGPGRDMPALRPG